MIPKVIHYIWLGKNKKPKNWLEVFQSWQKFAMDYEIKEWTEENISEFILPNYFYTAMTEKQWAFASDVLRCFILEKYGGLYLDIDQKLLRSLPDDFLRPDFFTAFFHQRKDYFGFGSVGTISHHFLMQEMINCYKTYDLKNGYEIINSLFSKILNKYLIENNGNHIKIFPQEYFYPEKVYNHDFSKAYAVHLANTSWIPIWKKILYKLPGYFFLKNILYFFLPTIIRKKILNIKYK